jgi:hypothetical protein
VTPNTRAGKRGRPNAPPARLSKSDRERATAFHEAGHAALASRLGRYFRYVTIKPSKDAQGTTSLGHVRNSGAPKWLLRQTEFTGISPSQRLFLEDQAIIGLAGQIAERRFYRRFKGLSSSAKRAIDRRLLRGATGDRGLAGDLMFEFLCRAGSLKAEEAYAKWCECVSECLVDLEWRAITALAAALVERKTIKHADAVKILRFMPPAVSSGVRNKTRGGEIQSLTVPR